MFTSYHQDVVVSIQHHYVPSNLTVSMKDDISDLVNALESFVDKSNTMPKAISNLLLDSSVDSTLLPYKSFQEYAGIDKLETNKSMLYLDCTDVPIQFDFINQEILLNKDTIKSVVIVTNNYFTDEISHLISFWSDYFSDCVLYSPLLQIDITPHFVYLRNPKSSIKTITTITSEINYQLEYQLYLGWKKCIGIRMNIFWETKILEELQPLNNTYVYLKRIADLLVTKSMNEYLKIRGFIQSVDHHKEELLRKGIESIFNDPIWHTISRQNMEINQLGNSVSNMHNLLDYYKLIQYELPNTDDIDMRNIGFSSMDEVLFTNLTNSVFVLQHWESYFVDKYMKNIIARYLKRYNLHSKNSANINSANVCFFDLTKNDNMFHLESAIKSHKKLILRVNIFDQSYDKLFEQIFNIYEDKRYFAPLLGRIYTNTIYLIFEFKINHSLTFPPIQQNISNIRDLFANYLIQFKMPIDYVNLITNDSFVKNDFQRKFLNDI